MAKSARVNLNRYWGLLKPEKADESIISRPEIFDREAADNRLNEILEERRNRVTSGRRYDEENSVNSEIDSGRFYSYSEPPMRNERADDFCPHCYHFSANSSSTMSKYVYSSYESNLDYEDDISEWDSVSQQSFGCV